MKNKKLISKLGYSDGSPFKDEPYLDIHTPNGKIDMSNTGVPLLANGRILPPYSGIHHFDTDIVREIPLPKAQSLGEIKDRLSNYLSGNEGLLPGNQTSIKQSVKDRLYNSVTPIAYDPKHAMKEFVAGKQLPFMWDGKETSFDEFQNQPMFRGDTEYGEYSKNASMDAWGNYLGMPQKYDTFKQSSYQPGSFSFNNDDDIWDDVLHLDIINKLKEGQDEQVYDSAAGGFSLNNYILKKELDKDIDMPYVSYRDKNDYNVKLGPFNIEGESIVGNPFNVYGRMYYDPETNERLSEEDIYKLKLDKSRNRNLQKQEGGEYEELELTDKEIEEYKKGGYVVEELPSYQTQGEVIHVTDPNDLGYQANRDSSDVHLKQQQFNSEFLSNFPSIPEPDAEWTYDFDLIKVFKDLKAKAGDPISNKKDREAFKEGAKELWKSMLAAPMSVDKVTGPWIPNYTNTTHPVPKTYKEILGAYEANMKHENVTTPTVLRSGNYTPNSEANWFANTDNSPHKENVTNRKIDGKNYSVNTVDPYTEYEWEGKNWLTGETGLNKTEAHGLSHNEVEHPTIKPIGNMRWHAAMPGTRNYNTNKLYTTARPNAESYAFSRGSFNRIDPESTAPGYEDANFYNISLPYYKAPVQKYILDEPEELEEPDSSTKTSYADAYKKVNKKKYPTLESFIEAAENYKIYDSNTKPESKSKETKILKSKAEEKKLKKSITKKEVIKKPEIPKGYALSKGYQRDGVSYGDMWHDIESTRPAISVGPTMDDYYAKYPKSSDIAIDDEDLKLGGELPKAHEGGNFGEHKHPHMNMNIPLNHNGPATLEEKFTNEKQNWNNYLSHPFYQQNAKTTWGDNAAVNIQNQRDRIDNTNIIYDNFSNDMHNSSGLYSSPNIEGEPGEIRMRDDLSLQNELHTIGHEVGHSTDVGPEFSKETFQKYMYPEFSDYKNLNLNYDVQFPSTMENNKKKKEYQEIPTEFRTRLNHVKSLMTENNFNWNEKSGEEINNWIEENIKKSNPLSLGLYALSELNDISRFNKIEKNQYSDFLGDEYRNYIDKDWRKAQGYNRFKKTWRKGIRTPEEWWNEYKGDNWEEDKEEFFKDRDGDGKPDMKMLLPEKKSIQDPKFLEHVFKRLAQQKNNSNEGTMPTAQSGGTVSQLWKQATGTPWSEAKKQGLTNGSYANNIALRKRIISGEFNSVPSQTSSRYIKEDFDYEKYGENIKRLLEKGNTLDDLVRKRIGTRAGLTNMFPELFDMPQMPEIPEQTFEPLTQNLPDTVVEEDVEVSNDPIVNVPDWISNPAYTPPLTSNTQVKETQEEPAEIPSWISQNPVQIDPNYAFPDKNKKQDGLKSFLSQFENDEEVLDNEQRQSLYLSVDQEKDKQKKAELIQQKEKEYLEQLKIEEQQRIDDYKNKMLIQYGKDKIIDLKQFGENVYEEAVSNINEIKNNTQEKLNKISYYINNAPWEKGYKNIKDYFELIGDTYLRSEALISSSSEEATKKEIGNTAFSEDAKIKTYSDLKNSSDYYNNTFKNFFPEENEVKQLKSIKEISDEYRPIANIEKGIDDLGYNKTNYPNFKLGKVLRDNEGSSTHVIDMSDGINVTYQPRNENANKRSNVNNAVTISDYLYDQDFTDGYVHEHAFQRINKLKNKIGNFNKKDQKFVTIREKTGDDTWNVRVIPTSKLKESDFGSAKKLPIAIDPVSGKEHQDYIMSDNKVYSQGYAVLSDFDISSDGNKIKLYSGSGMFRNQGIPLLPNDSGHVLRLPGGVGNYGKYQSIDKLNSFGPYIGGTVTIISDDGKIVKKITGSLKDIVRTAQNIQKQTNGAEVHFLQSDAGSMNVKASANNNNVISKDRLSILRNNEPWAGGSEILLNKKVGGEINQFELGGQYMDLDLTEEEIKEYQKGGFVIEDLPKAQNLGQVPELVPSYEFPYEYLEENTGNPEERLQFYGVNDPAKGAYPGAFDFRKDLIKYSDFSQPIGTSNAEGFEESDFRNKRHRGRKRRRNLLKGFRKDYVDDFKSKSQEWNDAKTLFGQEPFGNYLDLLPLNYGGELPAHQAPPGQVISSTYSEYPFQIPEIVDTNLNDTITPYSNKKRFNSYTITGDPNKPHRRSAGNIIYDMFHKPGSSEIKHDFNFKDGGENKYQKPPGEVSSYGLHAPIDATNDWGDGRVSDGIDPEVQKRIDDYYYSIPRVVNDINKQSPMAEFTGIPSALRIIDHPKQIAKDVVNTAVDIGAVLKKEINPFDFNSADKNILGNPYGSGIEGATDAMIMAPLIKPAGNVAGNVARNVLKSDKYVKPYLKNAYKYNPFATNLESKIAKENLLARQIYGDEAYEQFLKYGPTTEYGKNIPRHKQIREWLDADVKDVVVKGRGGKNKGKLKVSSTMTEDRNFKYPYFQKSKLFFSPNERALYNADMGKGRVIIPKDVNAESFYPAGETSFIRNVDTAPKDAVKMYSGEKYILSPFDKNSFNSKAFDVYEETPHWLMGNRKLSNPPKNLSNKLPNQKVIHPIDYNPVTGNPNVYAEPYLMSRQIPFTKEEEVLQSFYSPEKQRKLFENNTIKYDPQGNIIPTHQKPPGEVRELLNSLPNSYPEKGNPAIDLMDLDVFGTLNEFFVEPAKRVIQDPIGTVKSIGNTAADVASFFNPFSIGSAEPLIESMVGEDINFREDGNNAFGTPYWTDNSLALDATVVAPVLGSTFKALKTLPNKLPNLYKLNPWAAKEATEKMLVRARPVGQDPYVNMAENLRAKQAAGEELKWYQKNLLNPQTNPDMKAREKYFGQWFADNPSNLDYYINPATRNFSDNAQIEILKAQMPKELASKYSVKNFEDAKRLSNLPNSEYILPKDIIQKLEKYSLKDLPILQAEFNELNTPHWLKGYKPVEKPLKALPGSPNTNVFTPDPTKFYRGIGKEGYDDALTTGMFRQAQSHEAMPGISKHRGVHYGAGKEGFETASSYDSDYIVELSKDSFLETPTTAGYLGKPVVATGEHVPLNKGRILKKDKNGNYKEITKEQLEKDQLSKIPKTTKGPLSQSVLDAFLKGENKISKSLKASTKRTTLDPMVQDPMVQKEIPSKSVFRGNNEYNKNVIADNKELAELRQDSNPIIARKFQEQSDNLPLPNVDEYVLPLIENFNNPAARKKLIKMGIKDPDDFVSYLYNEVQWTDVPGETGEVGNAFGGVPNVNDYVNMSVATPDPTNSFGYVPNVISHTGDHEIGHLMQRYMQKRGLTSNVTTELDKEAAKFFRENKNKDFEKWKRFYDYDEYYENIIDNYDYTQKDYVSSGYHINKEGFEENLMEAKKALVETPYNKYGNGKKIKEINQNQYRLAEMRLDKFNKMYPNLETFMNSDKRQILEPLAHLRELRNELHQSGIIKNFQDPIDEGMLMKFWRSDNGKQNRILSFLQPSKKAKSGIVKLINKTPIVAGAIGTGTVLSQEKNGGEIGYKSKKEIEDLINQGYGIEYLD